MSLNFPDETERIEYDALNPWNDSLGGGSGKEWVWNDQKQRWEPYLSTATSFAELTDKASADLPGINGPLATALGLKADAADLGNSATKDVGTTAGTVAAGDHNHSGVYQPAGSYATSAQGELADTALQPADVGTIATKNYTQSDTPPSNPQAGDMWLETDTGMRFEFDGTFWVDIAGAAVTQANVRTALASGDNVELPSGQSATNDTSAITRALGDARFVQRSWSDLPRNNFTSASTGGTTNNFLYIKSGTTAGDFARWQLIGSGYTQSWMGVGDNSIATFWDTQFDIEMNVWFHQIQGTGVIRFISNQGTTNPYDVPTYKSIGFEVVGTSLKAFVYGSSLAYSDPVTVQSNYGYRIGLSYTSTTGILTMFLNGTSVATVSGGPTGGTTTTPSANQLVNWSAYNPDGGADNQCAASIHALRYYKT